MCDCSIRPLQSVSRPPLRYICMRAGSPFPLFHYGIGSLSSHYLPNYSHSKQPNSIFSLCLHLLHCKNSTNILANVRLASTMTRELTTLHNAQEKPENNRRIRNNGTLRAGNKLMQAVDGKQKYYLEWPKDDCSIRATTILENNLSSRGQCNTARPISSLVIFFE